ncbi:MAG: zeta toxin family protein [Patescibacteria group bacterium]
MSEEDLRIEAEAVEYIKTHKKEILERFCPPAICHSVNNPTSLFMAGSPGAGKTEVSKSFMKSFKDVPIRIDADEIRSICPGYAGTNAHLFQKAANKGVNFLYDHARHNDINCIMDGTFAYGGASENIDKSLKRNRRVEIWFVYQDPIRAWELTKAREACETRRVSKEVFIRTFFESRNNVRAVKEQFGNRIELNILSKDYEMGDADLRLNVPADELDRIVDDRYSLESLNNILI